MITLKDADAKEKETVLDDDASIYQRREKKTERQKFSEMKTPHDKLNYFRMYYLRGTLAAKGLVWQGGWLSNVCYQRIFENYFNVHYVIPTVDEYAAIIESRDYELMGIFPDSDSLAYIDGMIVIKLGDSSHKQ